MKIDFWQVLPYLLPIVSYVIGKYTNILRVPSSIRKLLDNQRVIEIIIQGIEAAQTMKHKSDDEKREHVRSWAKTELHKLLGEWLSDSAVNFLIEHTIVRMKK